MSNEEYPYPDDEFDALGASRVPQGVHREPAPRWRQWLPYLLVLILVPLLTFGVVRFFAGGSDPASESTTQESAAPSEPEGEPAPGDGEENPEEGTTEPEDGDPGSDDAGSDDPESDDPGEEEADEPAELDFNTAILVLNGARVQGLAGQVTEALSAGGWLNTEADNYENAAPTVTTLYYTSADYEAEAQEVAQQLGIETTVEDAAAASDGIVIVLRADFTLPDGN